jgi:thiosulfate/3-mercaptopyruvate sulfurtransferase
LNGGFAAWVLADQPVEQGERTPNADARTGTVTVRPGSVPTLGPREAAALGAQHRLVDVRTAERFRGDLEPIDPVAGHIPGAINLPASEGMSADLTIAPARTLRRRYADLGLEEGPVGVYCGSGVTAAHTVLAMHEAGIEAVLYPGSWSAWISDAARPVETGPGSA